MRGLLSTDLVYDQYRMVTIGSQICCQVGSGTPIAKRGPQYPFAWRKKKGKNEKGSTHQHDRRTRSDICIE